MLFVSIIHPDISPSLCNLVDGIELRLDFQPKIDLDEVEKFLRSAPRPVMLTLRKAAQGGHFQGSEEEREKVIEKLLALHPSFFDLEGDMRPDFLKEAIAKHPKTRFVLSHHDFEKTPDDLEEIYRSLSKYSPFTCKIAAMANSVNDALRLLLFTRSHPGTSGICMGEKGQFARVLGKIAGNDIDYSSREQKNGTAPGQLTAEELVDIYRYRDLDRETGIYGLIGDPVAKSPGHIYHNGVFRKERINAVYVKMMVKPDELEEFLRNAQAFHIQGLSVTIPLKEKVVPFVDEFDDETRQIGAVNTLLFKRGRIYGINTDGAGALDAIEKQVKVRGKKIVLIGAGGAARGIAFEAQRRGARIVILNRTLKRAIDLAAAVGGKAGGLGDVPFDADILVNCSPDPMPIDPIKIKSKTLVMDIVYSPRETAFLKEAATRGCNIVFGEEMYQNQAEGQLRFWLAKPHGSFLG